MKFRGDRDAFGGPGLAPRWAAGDKEGVGTSYSADCRLWFTIARGIVTEVYFPLIDHPQTRDLQYLLVDDHGRFLEEKRHLPATVTSISDHALGYRIRRDDPEGAFRLEKEVIAHPHLPCLFVRTALRPTTRGGSVPRIYALLAPHLDGAGAGNNGYVVELADRSLLVAERNGTWLALGADVPFPHLSVGYVGTSDGWTDLADNRELDWEFDRALDGNIALTAEVEPSLARTFTLAVAFGQGLENAVATLLQALGTPYEALRRRSLQQWERACRRLPAMAAARPDGARLYHASYSVLLGHEDKTFPGAFIASLSIPWGNSKGDDDRGGYHLVWTRDLVKTALGLLATGNTETPLRALIYLAAAQQADGGFPQNSWLNGEPYWTGVQLDEVSFPVLLAGRLHHDRALGRWDPYPMIRMAMRFLIDQGPATGQERWEELAGHSPSTLAANIAALVVAAGFARDRKDHATERFLLEYADFLEQHLERWTVTDRGSLDPAIPRHYIRICPIDLGDPDAPEDPNSATVRLPNIAPGTPDTFPAREIIDGGFLELVRYGIRPADDPIVLDSVELIDRWLKVDTPFGPVWHRYNHDGYGDRGNGDPFDRWGTGRAWPLLTGERGLYELAAGRDPAPYLHTLERLATATGLLPEQVWDQPESPRLHLAFGRPTGAATPLLWAHSEYLKLLRSVNDGEVFGRIPAVAERYLGAHGSRTEFEVWKPNRHVRSVRPGATLRVVAGEPFRLHVSRDAWRTVEDLQSEATSLGIDYVDLPTTADDRGAIVFTLYWPRRDAWEGRDYRVEVGAAPTAPRSSTPR